MQPNEYIKKIMKILIFAFLCTEMQTTYTQHDLVQKRNIGPLFTSPHKPYASYQASIRLLADEKDYYGKGHICSGALVAPAVVISASECLYNSNTNSYYHPSELRIILGNSQRFAPSIHGITAGVTHIHKPPKGMAIAILMLSSDIPANHPQIQSISLVEAKSKLLELPALISTWGYDANKREAHDMISWKIERGVKNCLDTGLCIGLNSVQHIETGATIVDKNGKLAGLKSRNEPEMFVNVANHVEWIQKEIGDGTNRNSSIWGILGLLVFTGYVLMVTHKR